MPDLHLHIIGFNVPYPPDYGGVIDVYYKIKALYKQGVKIHLHCFEYGRSDTGDLNNYCSSINLYKRKTGFLQALSLKPYIVQSRQSDELISKLLKDNHPVLFEGLHSCYYLSDKRLKNRVKIYRESNIEHRYYFNLFKIEKELFKKVYFLSEAIKLFYYQKVLLHANQMLVVSQDDAGYLSKKFPKGNIHYLPSFHSNEKVNAIPGKGEYVLYHGNLSVRENNYACEFLIKKVMSGTDIPFIVAGKNPPESLKKLAASEKNVTLIANPDASKMDELISNAQIHLLFTFQSTGLKLKLLNSLYKGRFHIVNPMILAGTGLEDQCHIANDANEARLMVNELFHKDFTEEVIESRKMKLQNQFDNSSNAGKLIHLISGKD